MEKVFIAQHPMEAHFVKGLLESEGIAADVRGEQLFTVRGGTPVTPETLPSVWIVEHGQRDKALELVANYERSKLSADSGEARWTCVNCGETLELQFTTCWQCGTPRPDAQ